MKTKLLLFTLYLYLSSPVFAQITNPGFENWAPGPGGFSDPVGWTTTSNFNGYVSVETGAGHTGNYSARIDYFAASPFYTTGQLMYNSGPISAKPITVSGWWKDQFFDFGEVIGFDIYVYDTNGDLMGSKSINSNGTSGTPNWTQFTAWITYTFPNNPVGYYTMNITTFSANTSYYGFVDDLTMTVTDIASKDEIVAGAYVTSQNGITLHANMKKDIAGAVKIIDMNGNIVDEQMLNMVSGSNNYTLTNRSLSSGIYICAIQGDDLHFTRKFSVQE